MPVEITGGWVRVEKGIGGRIVLAVVCAGLKPGPPKEGRRTDSPTEIIRLRYSISKY